MADEILLRTENLRREFGALVAVDDVSITVKARTLHSIIGPNGAGKTTFFNLLSGNLAPTSGKVFFKDQDITNLPLHRTTHLGMGRYFQITNILPNLTVLENVRLAAHAMGRSNFRFWRPYTAFGDYLERAHEVMAQVGLEPVALLPARTLPHGDQRKLELAMILAPDPVLLLLDEPTAGMASEQVPDGADRKHPGRGEDRDARRAQHEHRHGYSDVIRHTRAPCWRRARRHRPQRGRADCLSLRPVRAGLWRAIGDPDTRSRDIHAFIGQPHPGG